MRTNRFVRNPIGIADLCDPRILQAECFGFGFGPQRWFGVQTERDAVARPGHAQVGDARKKKFAAVPEHPFVFFVQVRVVFSGCGSSRYHRSRGSIPGR